MSIFIWASKKSTLWQSTLFQSLCRESTNKRSTLYAIVECFLIAEEICTLRFARSEKDRSYLGNYICTYICLTKNRLMTNMLFLPIRLFSSGSNNDYRNFSKIIHSKTLHTHINANSCIALNAQQTSKRYKNVGTKCFKSNALACWRKFKLLKN
jgi:hypothetical protein